MKTENSKLLLGLGIAALVGAAVGYLITGEHRRKLEEELLEVGHGIKDGARSVFSKVKAKAEHAGSKFAGKGGEWSEEVGDYARQWAGKAGGKADEWPEAAGNKASATADDLSQKANDFRQTMDNRAEADEQKQAQYAESYRKDVNNLKDGVKNSEKSVN